jgi:hypothetical protein
VKPPFCSLPALPPAVPMDLVGMVADVHGTPLDHLFEDGLRGAVMLLDARDAALQAACAAPASSSAANTDAGAGAASASPLPSTAGCLPDLCHLLCQRVLDDVPVVVVLLQTEGMAAATLAALVQTVQRAIDGCQGRQEAALAAALGASSALPGAPSASPSHGATISVCPASLLVPQSLVRCLLFLTHVLR